MVDVEIQLVDRIVAVDHLLRHDFVAFDERLNRALHGRRRQLAHREQFELDPLECVVEPFARHPNRPVTYASVRSSPGFVKIVSVRSNSTTVPVR